MSTQQRTFGRVEVIEAGQFSRNYGEQARASCVHKEWARLIVQPEAGTRRNDIRPFLTSAGLRRGNSLAEDRRRQNRRSWLTQTVTPPVTIDRSRQAVVA